ncbi:MAG TPA: DUF1127 domain-containing protein [Hyphomicrobiaceae bacterium]
MTRQMTLMSSPQSPARAGQRQFQGPFSVRLSVAARVARLARNRWRAYWDWRARKATVLLLRSLDARTLHDIGISPGEIESLVHDGAGDRCRRYDATWTRRR